MKLTRRDLLRRLTRTGIACSIAGGGTSYAYARTIEPTWLDVVHQDLVLPRLPEGFAGFTIAQLSDIHFGPYLTAERVKPTIDAVQNLKPDAIVLTGDFVTRVSHGEPDMIVQTLARLRAPQGVFAVLGNHDWWTNAAEVARALRQAGVTVLTNEHVGWHRDGQSLYLAGVDDVWCGKHDLDAALKGLPSTAAVVLLAHEPDFADQVAQDRRVMLQLSGHSHGGQIRLPVVGALHCPPMGRKYPIGLRQVGSMTLYTNRGIGMVGVPMRFWCRPEVTLFTLQSAAPEA